MALCKLQIELNRINMSAVNKTFLKFNRMDETSCVRLLIRAFFHDNDTWHVTDVDLLLKHSLRPSTERKQTHAVYPHRPIYDRTTTHNERL